MDSTGLLTQLKFVGSNPQLVSDDFIYPMRNNWLAFIVWRVFLIQLLGPYSLFPGMIIPVCRTPNGEDADVKLLIVLIYNTSSQAPPISTVVFKGAYTDYK
jgi:hypothetical protein